MWQLSIRSKIILTLLLTGLACLATEPSSASTRQWILADSTCASRTGEGTIKYNVVLSVSNPGLDAGPRDEFLSKFWYLAQRRGLRLDPSPGPDAATRLGMLEQGGAVRRDAGALPQLAQASVFRRYRRGDVLLRAGASAPDVFFVVAGHLAVTIPTGEGEIRLELVRSWELMVLQEMLAGGSSPVRVVAELDSDVLAIPAQRFGRRHGPQPAGCTRHQRRYRSTTSGYHAAAPRIARCRVTRPQNIHPYPYRPKVPYSA